MARYISFALCVCLWLGLSAVHARVRAQTAPQFDAAPTPVAPLRADNLPAPALRAGNSATSPSPKLQGADNPALDAQIARLRANALNSPANSARNIRAQANASWILGLLYLHGIGVATSPAEAASWFERARALGEPLAPAGLAWCEIEGCKNSPDPSAARRWIVPLRAVNLPRAQYLQWLIESRLSPLQFAAPNLRGDPVQPALPSRQLLLSAAQGGDIHARIELGLESLAANRPEEALAQFRAAAPRSAAAAANAALLSERLQTPTGTPEALAAASAEATFAQAQRKHRGEGQPANFVEAIRLYQLAQRQGSQQARKMLELIFSRPAPNGEIDIAWVQQLAYVNLSKDFPTLDNATLRRILRREPTPLFDLLPQSWRNQARPMNR